MGRRKQSAQWDLIKAGVIFSGLLLWLLHSQGLLVPLLLLIFGGIMVALVVVLIVFALKQWEKRPLSNVRLATIPVLSEPADIEMKCPRCESVLIAPAEMAGEPATCEGCRHIFGIPTPAHKFPDATHFYSPKRSETLSASLLKELEWKRFEQLVEGYFAGTGWETRPNRPGADGGVDVHLLRPGQPGVAAIVQCKAWQTYNVGVKPVRELFGVMAADRVPEGFFVTTGDYTGDARTLTRQGRLRCVGPDKGGHWEVGKARLR